MPAFTLVPKFNMDQVPKIKLRLFGGVCWNWKWRYHECLRLPASSYHGERRQQNVSSWGKKVWGRSFSIPIRSKCTLYVCGVYMYGVVGLPMCAYGGQRSISMSSSVIHHRMFGNRVYPWQWNLLSWLGQRTLGSTRLCPLSPGCADACASWKSKLSSSRPPRKHLTS